ncbi:P-type Ca(2+) transporter [Malassezia sp. CBS 17886]|nr:P-type Ca(2+) transporter [Malassezia sp. CBS 17886]
MTASPTTGVPSAPESGVAPAPPVTLVNMGHMEPEARWEAHAHLSGDDPRGAAGPSDTLPSTPRAHGVSTASPKRPTFITPNVHAPPRSESDPKTVDSSPTDGASSALREHKLDASSGDAEERAPKSIGARIWHAVPYFGKGEEERVEDHYKREREELLNKDPAPFKLKPQQLCELVDPEDFAALQAMGGTDGLLQGLGTSAKNGISADRSGTDEAWGSPASGTLEDRMRVYGLNKLPERKSKSLLLLMWLALQDKVLILLIVAAVVSLALGLYVDLSPPPEFAPCEHPPPGQTMCIQQPLDWVEGVAIMVAVVIVDLVGSLNDWQKERQFRALDAKKDKRSVPVRRNGAKKMVDVHDVLVGDVVLFEPGEIVAFDGVLLSGHNVKCDESSATGESDMINKVTYDEYLAESQARGGHPPKHASCFMLSGGKVLEGVGEFVVTAVGQLSFNGKLMMSLRDEPDNTPLQKKLNRLAELIAKLGTSAGLLLFVALMIRFFVKLGQDPHVDGARYGEKFIGILVISVTIIVVAVPEGLPLAITLALAFATRRMSNNNLLVRILGSCETMANATCICTDKTGTLTQNVMAVVAGCIGADLHFEDPVKMESADVAPTTADAVPLTSLGNVISPPLRECIAASVCINSTAFKPDTPPITKEEGLLQKKRTPWYIQVLDSFSRKKKKKKDAAKKQGFTGSKTETALLGFIGRLDWGDYNEIRNHADIEQMIPFSSERKAMGVVVRRKQGYRVYVKGASEVLLACCTSVVKLEGEQDASDIPKEPLVDAVRAKLGETIAIYASQSLRTIAFCYRDFDVWPPRGAPTQDSGEVPYDFLAQEMTMLAVTAIEDPLRHGVTEAVRACRKAGVQVKMCTGDNVITAQSIAKQCGIFMPGGVVMEGPDFRRLARGDLLEIAPRIQVLARSSPNDKKLLIESLKSMGEIVAVTGDGTNDGPALKSANVGFSMGIAGSEVAKEASDIILLDDNFSSIVRAVTWGRCVNDAVRKFLQFQFTVNIVAVVVTLVSAIASNDESSVLTAVQLLWLNLIMDTLAALALATDPADDALLDRKPDHFWTPLVSVDMWKQVVVQSIYQIILILVLNFKGASIMNLDSPDPAKRLLQNVQLRSMIFNVFVWCQLFNQVNDRSLDRNPNIFHNIFRNKWFMLILMIEVGMQVLIMYVGGAAFSVRRQTGVQWAVAIVAGFISWPLGFIVRLCPTQPVERFMIKFKLMPDPNALPQVAPDKKPRASLDPYSDWNEPAIGELAKQLGAFSRVRGGRLRASNLVMKSDAKLMREKNIHPQSLLAIIPAFIGASVGSAWKSSKTHTDAHGASLVPISTQDLYSKGRIQFHPDTPIDDDYLRCLQGRKHPQTM